MREYFVVANSKAAPFVSDMTFHYIKASTQSEAKKLFIKSYKHCAGLFAANFYFSANDYHKGEKPICTIMQSTVGEQND